MTENGDRPEWLSFKDAVAWAGVSRQRLNQAIWRGEIEAERGGPGVKARINYQSLNRWLYARGLLTRTPEPSTSTTLERLERLVEMMEQRLGAMAERLGAMAERLGHIDERLDQAFTAAEEAHKIEVRRLEEKVAQLEEASKLAAAWTKAGRVELEEPSARQVGTVGTALSLLVREGRPYSDQDVAVFLAESGWDAGGVQRCLDQLRADGRYQQLMERAHPP